MVGVGYIDVSSRLLQLAEFTDNDSYGNLEALLVQLSPKEVLVPTGEGKTTLGKVCQLRVHENGHAFQLRFLVNWSFLHELLNCMFNALMPFYCANSHSRWHQRSYYIFYSSSIILFK